MSEEATLEDLETATREWVRASEAVRQWRDEHFAVWWPESEEPRPPEPKPVTREALAELERLRLEEQQAQERWAEVNRALLRRP
jgi:hypothetical protein